MVAVRWAMEPSFTKTVLFLSVPAAASLVLDFSSRRTRSLRRAWRWIALSIFLWMCGDVVWYALDASGTINYPSAADALYLAGYPAFVIGLLLMTATDRPRREIIFDLIDVSIVALSAGLLLWPFVIEPTIEEGWGAATFITLGYTSGDILLVGLLAALWFNTQKRMLSISLLAAAAIMVFMADNLYYIPSYSGVVADNFADTLWLAGYVLIAAAALAGRTAGQSEDIGRRHPLRRVIFVGFALFSIPGVIALDGLLGDGLAPDDWKALVVIFGALIALVVLRGTLMFKSIVRSRESADTAHLRLATMVDAAGVGIVITSDKLMAETNKDFQEMLGYTRDELARMSYLEIVHPDEVADARLRAGLPGGTRATFPNRLVRRDGTSVEVQITLTVSADKSFRVAVIEDITARLQLERQLAEGHKLEAVGRLAGGIAHDFNNLLTAVSGHAELIRDTSERLETAERVEIDESVNVILDASARGADLTRQLLTFSRLHEFNPQQIETPEVLYRTENLLRRLVGSQIALETQIDPLAPPIFADPSQIDQVLMNLAVNARDAMPAGGTLTLTLAGWTQTERGSPRYAAISPGEYCRITVGDTGVGMNSTVLEHIFEPFYTTKDVGKGTGLGLATSYGIVSSIGGHILVSSQPDLGTVFEIILPIADVSDEDARSRTIDGVKLVQPTHA